MDEVRWKGVWSVCGVSVFGNKCRRTCLHTLRTSLCIMNFPDLILPSTHPWRRPLFLSHLCTSPACPALWCRRHHALSTLCYLTDLAAAATGRQRFATLVGLPAGVGGGERGASAEEEGSVWPDAHTTADDIKVLAVELASGGGEQRAGADMRVAGVCLLACLHPPAQLLPLRACD